jgi:NitT/TauT family transport system substrate-binding protein
MTQMAQNRRRFLATLSAAGATRLIDPTNSFAQEAPPETTIIRLAKNRTICIAPQYVVADLLRLEGFTEVHYVATDAGAGQSKALARGDIDFTLQFSAVTLIPIDAGERITIIAGIHVGCFELFGSEGVHSIASLKGKTVGIPELGTSPHVFLSTMAAHVGLDPAKDINWVTSPSIPPMELFAERKVDAFLGFPPEPQELRARNIGRVVVNSSVDRPWSQYFCCVLAAARRMVEGGFTARYDYALQTLKDVPYNKWREYDPEDTIRFYALRLRESGFIRQTPNRIIADATDWRFLNELKRELKG